MWIDDYGDELDGGDPMVTLNVYYLAEPLGDSALAPDASEIAEIRWFAPDELPSKLAFQGHIPEVLTAWRAVVSEPPA